MAKTKECPTCRTKVETDNKGKIKTHFRWTWPGWPTASARSSEMYEVKCEGSPQ